MELHHDGCRLELHRIIQWLPATSESREKEILGKKIKAACALLIAGVLAASCAGLGFTPSATETPIPTATAAPTQTPMPTDTATPALDYGIDLQKFRNFPESYEYLLSHLDEFVQAPDPIDDRIAFDRWFSEQLMPALGPVSERTAQILNRGGAGGNGLWEVYFDRNAKKLGLPPVFWFKHNDTVHIVPCITTEDSKVGSITRITLCPALFDSPTVLRNQKESLEALRNDWRIDYITIIYDPSEYLSDLSWSDHEQQLVTSIGDYPLDDHAVKFGFGIIAVWPK